jgi:hypothetical protein
MSEQFPYAFDRRFTLLCRLFGVRPARDRVLLTDDQTLRACFGFVTLETPLSNVNGAHITKKYRWWKAIGIRGSLKDSGLTFGTNTEAGVCIHFATPVRSPLARRKGHDALTVTVESPEALVEALGY